MKVHASSAIATLTIPANDLASDPCLQLVLKTASSLQLTVKTPSKGSTLHLELLGGTKLTHRNSIIRCLCGMGLHNALDGPPYYFLGGHSSPIAAAPIHAIALASLSSWMSVADQLRKTKSKASDAAIDDLLEQLNTHLESRAYLIDSPAMTIADVDIAVVIAQSQTGLDNVPLYPHLHRWIMTIQNCMQEQYDISISKKKVPSFSRNSNDTSSGPQLFFFGNETNVKIPKIAAPKSTKGKTGSQAGGEQQNDENQQQPQQQQSKKVGKQQAKQKQPQATSTEPASYDISALDIRVGQIVKVWHHSESEKLFCEEIDVGEDQPRQIASGLRHFYQASDLENRRVVVLCNLKSRKLVGFPSHGMVLCASNADHTKVECMEPPADAKIGERVTFEGYTDGEPEVENKIAKKKIFEAVAPDLKTNADGICVWKDAISQTSAGPIKASNGMPNAQVS